MLFRQKKLKLEIVVHDILRLESGIKCNEEEEGVALNNFIP